MLIAITLISIILLLLFTEKWYLNRLVSKIPIRILINGTRGKSTSVKYIAALLRLNDFKVLSKITGIIPTIYFSDNESEIINRRGGARVTEQFGVIRKAAGLKVDAIVLECMSINPELQKLEGKVLRPHFYIITNIKEDHLEELGSTPEEWAESICEAIPKNCIVITTEKDHLETIKRYAAERGSKVIANFNAYSKENILIEGVHPDNLNLVEMFAIEADLKVNEFYDRLRMIDHEKLIIPVKHDDFNVSFVNAFSANDVPSAKKVFNDRSENKFKNFVVFNSRADRPFRTVKFMEWLSGTNSEKYFLTGTNTGLAKRILRRGGIAENKIIKVNDKMCDSFTMILKEHVEKNSLVFGFGNIKGSGIKIINSLTERV
ncbi:MAG: poly-gamma-glutamate synthase PgsB [Bacteroidetes bacterium]|nr:poly-gamma-glutamate synthase PgsB [Bacteroidota bacterium]